MTTLIKWHLPTKQEEEEEKTNCSVRMHEHQRDLSQKGSKLEHLTILQDQRCAKILIYRMFASLLCVSGSPFKALTNLFTTVKNVYPLVALYNIKLFCCAGSDELYETTVLLQFSQIHYSRRNLDQAYHSHEVIFGSMALS